MIGPGQLRSTAARSLHTTLRVATLSHAISSLTSVVTPDLAQATREPSSLRPNSLASAPAKMLPLPALRAPSHALRPHTLGLTICQRTFTTTPTTLLRRLPHRFSPPPRTATLPSSRHPLLLTTAAAALTIPFFSLHTRNDASPAAPDFSSSAYTHGRDAKVPITKDGGLNPAAIRQISFGSLAGLGLGVLVSAFSRMLVLVIGISVVAVQVRCSFSPELHSLRGVRLC